MSPSTISSADASEGVAVARPANDGIVETPLHDDYESVRGFYNTLAPTGTTGMTQDVVDAVLYLSDSSFTTGVVLPVDGGAAAGVF